MSKQDELRETVEVLIRTLGHCRGTLLGCSQKRRACFEMIAEIQRLQTIIDRDIPTMILPDEYSLEHGKIVNPNLTKEN